MPKRVVVGMSGGVDSSVAAAMLVQQGYEVIGVTLDLWPRRETNRRRYEEACCALAAVEDAQRVADTLRIPHYVLNFRDVFDETVIQDFVNEYRRGRTPNPCIRCNRFVKFDAVLQRLAGLDADLVATGHYARVSFDHHRGRYVLKKAVDRNKDQSYVLYPLSQNMLSRTLFPLGDSTKEQTREMATKLRLPVAEKAESQEICFVPNDDYASFLMDRDPSLGSPGAIVDCEGRRLGEHRGIAFYTVGQRRGLGLQSARPLFVVAIDASRNELVVGEEKLLYADGLLAEDVNWVSYSRPIKPISITVKVRYRAKEVDATVTALPDSRASVQLSLPQKAVTPGQSAVFYDGDLVVGGGIIEAARSSAPCPRATSATQPRAQLTDGGH